MGNLSKPVTVLRPNRQTSDRENGATSASTSSGSGMGEDGGGSGVRGSGSGDGISAFAAIARGVGLTSSSSSSSAASTWRKQTLGSAVPSSDYDQVLNGDENAYPALPSRHQQQQRRDNEGTEGVALHRRAPDASKAGSGGDATSFKGTESEWAPKKIAVSGGSGSEFSAPFSPDEVSERGSSVSPSTTGAPKKIAVSISNSGASATMGPSALASGVAQERGSSSSPANVAPKKIAVSTSGGVAQERGASSSPSTVAAPPTKTPVLATAPVDYAKKLAPIPEMVDR